jgi:3-dehydroquinate synthase
MNKLSLHIEDHETSILVGRDMFTRLEQIKKRKLIILIDENVYKFHGAKLADRECIIIPQGEKQKSLTYVEHIFREMLKMEADRTSFLLGIGGGMVTDLAGFVASTYMRGIDFGFISSTLLGQVDASIGGKNGVNLDGYKNMIGVIRQPEFVWCDLDLLSTLDHSELVSGFSEVIKYGAIRNKELFEFLEENYSLILRKDPSALEYIITQSASIKIDIVQNDVSEMGERKLLNFGHTLGHAVEKLSGMLHGEAIAIGMTLATRLSTKLGSLSVHDASRLINLIEASGLAIDTNIGFDELYETLLKDKKRSGENISFILLRNIGEAYIHKISLDSLKTALNDLH